MKRLVKLMVVAAFALSPLLGGASASAQQATCEIGYTGPDSNNMCTQTYNCSVTDTNTNTVTITNSTNQTVASGTVTVNGNTSGGSGTSGTVSNSNGTVFSVTITNTAPQNQEACTATVTVPATQPPETVVPTGSGQVAALPKTSSDMTLPVVSAIALGTLALAALCVGGVLWYRHRNAE